MGLIDTYLLSPLLWNQIVSLICNLFFKWKTSLAIFTDMFVLEIKPVVQRK